MFLFGMNLILFAQKNKLELKSNFFLTDPVSGKQVSQNFDVVNTSSSFDNYIVCVGCKKVNDYQYEGGKWGVVDNYGAEVLPLKYSKIEYSGSYMQLELNGYYGLANKRGEIVIQPQFKFLYTYNLPAYWYGSNSSNLYGLCSSKNDTIIPFEYKSLTVTNDYVIVEKENGKGLMNLNGETIFPAIYDELDILTYENKTRVKVKSGANFQILDLKGNVIINNQKGMEAFYDPDNYSILGGFWIKKEGKVGLISPLGEEILPPVYDDLISLKIDNSLCFIAKKDKKYGVLNQNGKTIFPFKYDFIDQNKFGNCLVVSNDGEYKEDDFQGGLVFTPKKYSLIDIKSEKNVKFEFNRYKIHYNFITNSSFLIYRLSGLCGVIDEKLAAFLPCQYTSIEPTGNNNFIVTKGANVEFNDFGNVTIEGGSWSLLNSELVDITKSGYEQIDELSGYSCNVGYKVKKSGLYGIIGFRGEEITPCEYSDITCSDEGFLVSKFDQDSEKDKYGLLDVASGKEVIPCIYDLLEKASYASSNFIAKKDKKLGILDKNGSLLIDFKHDYLGTTLNDDFFLINQYGEINGNYASGGKFGLINNVGKEIIPCEYKAIESGNSNTFFVCKGFDEKSKLFDVKTLSFVDAAGVEEFSSDQNGYVGVGKNIKRDNNGFVVSGTYGLLSKEYKLLVPIGYNYVVTNKEFIIAIDSSNSTSDLFNKDGKKILDKFSFIKMFNDSLLIVSKEGKLFNLFNIKQQKNVFKKDYLSLNSNNQIIIAVNENNLKGVISASEEVIVPFDYCEIQCSEDYFNVQYIVSSCADINKGISANFGVISAAGKTIIPMIYEAVLYDNSINGYQCFLKNKKINFDSNGEEIKK